MHWEILIIPLIALGVWIIGTLFKSEEDKIPKGVGRRSPLSGRTPGRRLMTDLDRFLEETRRRQPEEPRRAAPPIRVPSARPPLRARPPQPRERPRPVTPAVVKEEAVVVLPAARPPGLPIAQPTPVSSSPQLEVGKAGTLVSREPPAPSAPTTRPLPIAQQVCSLLRTPQAAATAFVLREIFDRPLCKRRH